MKKVYIYFMLFNLCFATINAAKKATPLEKLERPVLTVPETFQEKNIISPVGDSRSLLGPAGKNICVCSHGDVIAVMYGPSSDPYDPNQPFSGVYVAYSTDSGATWNHYGLHNQVSPLRRIYPAVDGCDNFCTENGNLFFVWQEGQVGYNPVNVFTMVGENIPALPSFSPPTLLPGDVDGWMPCIGVNPDDNSHVMITAWSYLLDGNRTNYAWISTDGGWTWSDKFMVTPPVDASAISAGAGHFRWGTGGYAFFTYHDEYDPAIEEQTVESTPKIHLEVQPTIVNRHLRVLFTGAGRNHVSLKCYDTSGRLIQMIYEGNCDTGSKILNLDVSEFANGVYIVVLESSSGKQKIKLVKLE